MTFISVPNPLPTTGAPSSIDPFGRKRGSELKTWLDIKHTQDGQPEYIDQATNATGSIAHQSADSEMEMTTAASGDWAISMTKQATAYLSGKGVQVIQTTRNFHVQTNVTKRFGYWSSSIVSPYTADVDGIYWDNNGTDIGVVLSKFGTANRIDQANWNNDKFDGTGPSGITIDFEKPQIYIIDFGWLGYNDVRFGFKINGDIHYCHIESSVNTGSTVYMRYSNQPMRWEIRQNGAGSGVFTYVCATVGVEGEGSDIGKVLSTNMGGNHLNADTSNTKYAMLGLRLKSTALHTFVQMLTVNALAETQDNFLWELQVNPTIDGTAPTFADIPNSDLQKATGVTANDVTADGIIIGSGYVAVSRQAGGVGTGIIENAIRLGSNIDGTRDEIWLCITPLTANLDTLGSMTWREYN